MLPAARAYSRVASRTSRGRLLMATTTTLRPRGSEGSRRRLLGALRALSQGDFSVRMPIDGTGLDGELALAFNDIAAMNAELLREVQRITTVVGTEGRIGER